METCLKYDVFIYDVIMDLFGIIFSNVYYQQNCMIIGFNMVYNFNLLRLKPNFSSVKRLLHVFRNTQYTFTGKKKNMTFCSVFFQINDNFFVSN